MAQFLGHEEQKPDELNQFYNIEGNQTVQYVIADDHHQQFPSQQIVVVDGSQSQSVILDQSQITYQALPQYTIEGGDQQVFFMEGTANQPIQQVIQSIASQSVQAVVQAQPIQQQTPIVLNHNIGNVNKTLGQVVQSPVQAHPEIRPTVRLPMQQIRPAQPGQIKGTPRMQQPRHQMPGQQRPPLDPQQQQRPRLAITPQRPQMVEQQQAVALPDGTIVSVAAYKRMIEQKNRATVHQQQQQQQQRIPSGVPNNQMDNDQVGVVGGGNPTPAAKKRAPANRGNVNRGGRAPARGGRVGMPANQQQQQQANSMPGNFPPNQSQFGESPVPRQYQAQHQRNLIHQRNQPPQRPMLQQQRSQANYVIQPPNQHKPTQHRPLPSYIPSSQIQQIIENTPVSEEFSDSIRMLVLLDNGEQRLITFTLPKEACTIQEILEQVNVPFQHDTNIQVTEANTNGINYIVTVGEVPQFQYQEENEAGEGEQPPQQEQPPNVAPPQPAIPEAPPKEPSPEPVKEIQPKYLPGQLALCKICGYLSEDFAKCMRCQRVLPDDVKAIQSKVPTNGGMPTDIRSPLNEKKLTALKNGTDVKPSPTMTTRKKAKPKAVEHETVCLVSSDEEDDPKTPAKSVNEQLLSKLGASISISPVTKEPSLTDIQKHVMNKFHGINQDILNPVSMNLLCRTVRIGSYRFVPTEKILIESSGVTLKVPHPNNESEIKTVRIDQGDIVRVLVNFNKALPLLFYYLTPTVGANVRELLGMEKGSEPYFNPLSEKDESHKRITLLPEEFTEEDKTFLQEIYTGPPHNILDELLAKEANDILVKTCPKDLNKSMSGGGLTEIKPLLQYPPEGRGRLTINTEDYICLATDQFLNDVIIDFYLKYLINNLPKEKQEKVHVFSTFFYKRLTTKPQKASRKCQPTELDNTLTAAQKRHARVKTWTKTVNLFEKDFVIVPINENAHWFLAIICFPGMDGPHTFDGQPYKLEPKTPKKKKNLKEKEKLPLLVCDDPELSDKDEAEGDESDMDSDDSDASTPSSTQSATTVLPAVATASPVKAAKVERPPIKQPCIFIFDSLAGNCRSRVVATLRDYLTCEYKAKMDKDRIFNKDVIKGSCIKVPQQNNFTDCGLYVLQYVEQFFKDPIVDYNLPMKQLKNWFDEIVVTRKREEISELIKNLMMEYDIDLGLLPNIKFPTLNGKLVERCTEENENEDMFEDSSFEDDEEHEPGEIVGPVNIVSTLPIQDSSATMSSDSPQSVIKPSDNSMNETFNQCIISALKPDLSEFPRQTTDKDTLSYLKAKRIIRHKLGVSEGPDAKKAKSE
ncbi:unnamed protein product [Brassicogethes aeneus]|uniref:Ubiquitin-like protease family profile domain-containing protein n=1 Tax=Brassicogethes aeneus TaxID=1431903 RepID=A0A9P0FJL4_BRAAE|nr:unnamed protein product [Brassicogethes aeneus]